MRLFPPVPANSRVLAEDMEIEGHMMPKGTTLGTSIYTVHRHPDFWENPNVSSEVIEGRCVAILLSCRTLTPFVSHLKGLKVGIHMPMSHFPLDQGNLS